MERNKEIYKVTLVGGAVNVILLLFKFVAGIFAVRFRDGRHRFGVRPYQRQASG